MDIKVLEIVNLLIVLVLAYVLTHKKDVVFLCFVLFLYGTLHFTFSAISLGLDDHYAILVLQHIEGGGLLANLSALFIICIIYYFLSKTAFNFLSNIPPSDKGFFYVLLVLMLLMFVGYLFNYRSGDWLQFKNIISFSAMLFMISVGYLGLTKVESFNVKAAFFPLSSLLIILIVMDIIAVYEVFYRKSWAGTLQSTGEMVHRASGTLFNPNLLAFWASLIYLGCCYLLTSTKDYCKQIMVTMVLASLAIYLSGARSVGYLLLGLSVIPALLIKGHFRYLPLVVQPFSMLFFYATVKWLLIPISKSSEGWQQLVFLGHRFVEAPIYLIKYIGFLLGYITTLPPEVIVSINGRFIGDGRDSGWMVFYQDVGWLGIITPVFICLVSLVLAIKSYIRDKSSHSVYAICILLNCILVGVFMRFQTFPLWLFMGVVLIPCVAFWSRQPAVLSN